MWGGRSCVKNWMVLLTIIYDTEQETVYNSGIDLRLSILGSEFKSQFFYFFAGPLNKTKKNPIFCCDKLLQTLWWKESVYLCFIVLEVRALILDSRVFYQAIEMLFSSESEGSVFTHLSHSLGYTLIPQLLASSVFKVDRAASSLRHHFGCSLPPNLPWLALVSDLISTPNPYPNHHPLSKLLM